MARSADKIGVQSRLNGLRVLIVDDCRAYRRAMAAMALLHGADITERESAATGLMALDHARFDLVVTDIGLPDMSGAVVAARAKRDGAAVLAVSAEAGPDAAPAAHGFASKPFTCVADFAGAMIDTVILHDTHTQDAHGEVPRALAV